MLVDKLKVKHKQRTTGWLKLIGIHALILVVLLAGLDWLLVQFDLLRPPFRYGDPHLGFVSGSFYRMRNTLNVETSSIAKKKVVIAMVGDSHSVLRLDSPFKSHEFLLETILRQEGIRAVMISAGQGKYSPLQEYLLYKKRLKGRFSPQVVLMNFYSGNDFYDLLRPDDRPHYSGGPDGFLEIRKPVWFSYVDPEQVVWRQQSRMLWLFDEALRRFGYPRILRRVLLLTTTAERFDGNVINVIRYLHDVQKSIEPALGYSGAFAAQILNQAIFFDHFPNAKQQSLVYVQHLLRTAVEENPDVIFVMSVIPSAALVGAIPSDVAHLWERTLHRVGMTEESVQGLENEIYDKLRKAAHENGWVFVDHRGVMKANAVGDALYNSTDLHINELASSLIGRQQARVLLKERIIEPLLESQ